MQPCLQRKLTLCSDRIKCHAYQVSTNFISPLMAKVCFMEGIKEKLVNTMNPRETSFFTIMTLFTKWIPANSILKMVFTLARSKLQEQKNFGLLIRKMVKTSVPLIFSAKSVISPITELLNPTPMMITKLTNLT